MTRPDPSRPDAPPPGDSENTPSSSASAGRILVFTATYNERDNIEEYCDRILGLADERGLDLDLLVVDDNSPDGTGHILDRRSRRDPRVRAVHRPAKLGLGSAHKIGMIHAIRGEYDVLITMDADFSHDPDEIPALLDQLESHDFVTGSRYAPGGRCDYTGYRQMVSRAANVAARSLLGIPLHEFTTSYRAFRVSALASLDISSIKSQGYSFFLESIFRLARHGFSVSEIPIHFADRVAGQSKIPRLEIFRGMSTLLSLLWTRLTRRTQEPAKEAIEETCYCCQQPYLIERFRPEGYNPTANDLDAAAFQCTSMEHRAKPPVVSCLHCGLAYVPAAAMAPNLDELYADVVDETYLANRSGRDKTFATAYERLSPHLPEGGGKMLEIGSYCGFFMDIAKEKGWEIHGVEPSRWASKVAQENGHDVYCGTIDDPEFVARGEQYDAIVMWDVLEHVPDPVGMLERANSFLKDDGVMCLSTLDTDSWFPRLAGRRWPWYMSMHIFYFSAQSMAEVYRRAGYRMEEVRSYCHFISVRYFVEKVSTLLPRFLGKPIGLLRYLAPKSLFLPFQFGDIKMYTAKKREAPLAAPASAPAAAANAETPSKARRAEVGPTG